MAIDEITTDTTKVEEPVDVPATADEPSKDDADTKNTDNQPDYKAIALAEREKREKAEKALAEKNFKLRESKRREKVEEVVVEDDIDEDKPITSKELQRILAENTQQTEKRLNKSQIVEFARSLGESQDEIDAIVETHSNRVFPSDMSLTEQVEEAFAIVNRKKLISTNIELKRALLSKTTASTDVATTHRDPMQGTAPKMSPNDTASYKRAGFTFDTKDKVWKKKLPNTAQTGKFLIKDPKSKTTYIAK